LYSVLSGSNGRHCAAPKYSTGFDPENVEIRNSHLPPFLVPAFLMLHLTALFQVWNTSFPANRCPPILSRLTQSHGQLAYRLIQSGKRNAKPPKTATNVATLMRKSANSDIAIRTGFNFRDQNIRGARNFDTSPAALQLLKKANLGDSLILAMVEAPVGPAEAAPPTFPSLLRT
jgi:hypothetical protein